MDLQPDEWMGNILGSTAYHLKLQKGPYSSNDSVLAPLSNPGVFAFSKVPVMDLDQAAFLESLGFHLVDTNVLLQREIRAVEAPSDPLLDYDFASTEDDQGATALASNGFIYTRFHQDSQIDNAIADQIKGAWVHNFFLGKRGQHMVVAKDGQKVVGFLQLLQKEGQLIIDLIATHPDYRKRGIANNMITFAEAHCKGASEYLVGTQIANIPSIRLYQKMGFSLTEAKYVFHYHSQAKR